ncbi:preprotein translocase subunit YajC [Acetobacter estunensis]|uniref:preprotein translocase subunit YajC n=1 Tax=Acetobacter estunensis TaxID=104097 RepID=UPI001C2DBEEA|nr:preprotein translocase subunit YajC [Acetobacter estunensis]MBV1838764.1 preprotein translocase subunit YajC [Acetobacter estunensis]
MIDLLISPAHAQSAGAAGATSGLLAFLPYIAIFAIFYFLMIRPQQQKQKKLKEELAQLRRGDRVLTAGGIIGVVRKVVPEGDEVDLEIASGVVVRVLRSTITAVLTAAGKPANDPAPAAKN